MGNALSLPQPGFDELNINEQIEYVQALWDRIAAKEDRVPVPDWHREIVDERLADLQANHDAGRPWKEVRAELVKGTSSRNDPRWELGQNANERANLALEPTARLKSPTSQLTDFGCPLTRGSSWRRSSRPVVVRSPSVGNPSATAESEPGRVLFSMTKGPGQ